MLADEWLPDGSTTAFLVPDHRQAAFPAVVFSETADSTESLLRKGAFDCIVLSSTAYLDLRCRL
ncbi:MAG: hypothetical protein OHK0039_46860 [Bacteroidia bacterium]